MVVVRSTRRFFLGGQLGRMRACAWRAAPRAFKAAQLSVCGGRCRYRAVGASKAGVLFSAV